MTPEKLDQYLDLLVCFRTGQCSPAQFRQRLDADPEFAVWYAQYAVTETAELKPRTTDPVVDAVRADLLRRSQIGIVKYGVTLARTDLNLRDWLQHAYEETLDQANYLKRAIIELEQPNG